MSSSLSADEWSAESNSDAQGSSAAVGVGH